MSNELQLIALAILQGLTEFLPVSSSAHLILLPKLTGWHDQGLLMDVSVHFGTLLAVVLYFKNELKRMVLDSLSALKGNPQTPYSHMALQLCLSTIPVCVAGFLFHDLIAAYGRSLLLIAATTILFGGLMWASISFSNATQSKVTYKTAVVMGFAQVLALIPGTSRSGITLTAALFMGLSKQTAARFAFLMAIPVIIAAMSYEMLKLIQNPVKHSMVDLGLGIGFSAVVAWLCIHYFLKLIDKIGLIPFVIYRFCLGFVLLGIFFLSA